MCREKMMPKRDEKTEEIFVNTFIVKNRRERLLYELSGKKRKACLARFCHDTLELVEGQKIAASGNDLHEEEIVHIIREHTNAKNAYIMAYNEDIDAVSCGVQAALKKTLGNGMAAIVITDNVVVVETEQCRGTPEKYILVNKK